MATQLTDIKLSRISMVDAGANQHADILLAKRKGDAAEISDADKKRGFSVEKKLAADQSLRELVEQVGDATRRKYGPPIDSQNSILSWVYIHDVFDGSVIFSQQEQMYRAPYTIEKTDDGRKIYSIGDRVPVKIVYRDMTEKSAKAARKGEPMEQNLETVQAELAKAKADGESTKAALEALTKRLDEQAAKNATLEADVAKANAAAAENATKAAQAEEVAKSEREARMLAECIAIGKSKFGTLPLKEEEKGALIKTLKQKLTVEEYAEVEKLFVSHEAALKQLGNPPGTSGSTTAGGGSAYDRMQSLAKARQAEKNIDFSKALSQITTENPDLYREYLVERRAN
jgi:hypothetical protein